MPSTVFLFTAGKPLNGVYSWFQDVSRCFGTAIVAFQMITCSWSAAISICYMQQCPASATGPNPTRKEQDNDDHNQQDVEEEGAETLGAHFHRLSCLEQFTPRRILQHIVHVPQCS